MTTRHLDHVADRVLVDRIDGLTEIEDDLEEVLDVVERRLRDLGYLDDDDLTFLDDNELSCVNDNAPPSYVNDDVLLWYTMINDLINHTVRLRHTLDKIAAVVDWLHDQRQQP